VRGRRLDHPRPWHRGSVYGAGPRRPLDRERRARFRYLLHAHARAGRLTAKAEWVLTSLLDHLSRDGRCDPSHERLAADSSTSVSTVIRTLEAARRLGLVFWQRRIVRAGWRTEQTSNSYMLDPSGEAPARAARPASSRTNNLESCFTAIVTVAAESIGNSAFIERQRARIAAKITAEREQRKARDVPWTG
jgi:hypothetical protein